MSGRILAVATVPLGRGGIGGYLLSACERMGLPVDLVTVEAPDAGTAARVAAFSGTVTVLPRRRRPLSYARALSRLVRRGGYGCVWCHGNSATLFLDLLAAKRGGALVRIAHAHNTGCTYPRLHRLLQRPMVRLCTARLACSQAAGRFLYGDAPFTACKNGIDTANFRFAASARQSVRARLCLPEEALVIGAVGTLSAVKDPLLLLEAFARVHAVRSDARLLFVGDGPLRGALEAARSARGLSDAVLLLGARAEVPALLSAMDVFALPSLREGFPLALLEAQASGLPCVAADTVDRGADLGGAVTFVPRKAEALAEALLGAAPAPEAARKEAFRAVAAAGYDLSDTLALPRALLEAAL